ncbi:MAG TPA: ABC-F family ATP-binding cassette domain-containing protein [Lentimicrobium sp.]|nr:ABC-F family ATP-binding cassette domain-containing protein [Lentimicrobium sp.]
MLSVNNLSVYFTGKYLFDNVSFLVNERDRIGLVGKNGAGKTTLLRIINGNQIPETGNVSKKADMTIGYLPQEMISKGNDTIFNETLKAFEKALQLKAEAEELSKQITERTDYHSISYLSIIQKLHDCNDHFTILGGNDMEGDTEKVLQGLGFKTSDFNRKISEFSGGWKMRVELAKLLLKRPDLLLLDEPTNHLDIESIQWLEEYLQTFSGAVILVSHDRAFLDNVTSRTIEITLGKIYDFKCSYSEYVDQRADLLEQQLAAFENQQKQIADIERFIERFRYKATKSRQVQSRIKMLEKVDRIEVENIDKSAIHFKFPPAPPSGRVVVEAKDLAKYYGHKRIFEHVDFAIERSDFVAFVGKNGEGKTTMAKVIVENLQHTGECNIGYNVKIGYYAQNQADLLNPDKTVFETIDDIAVGDIRPKVRNILGSFLFTGEDIDKKVKVLSGGEKSRLALARLLLTPVNLLVLDEPTNHLDMISKDILKNALLMFDGTLIVVSHDRDFLQGLTQKVFEFRDGSVKQHLGDVYAFLEKLKIRNFDELSLRQQSKSGARLQETASDNKQQYEKRKAFEKELRKINNKIGKVEEEINLVESEITEIDHILADPEKYKSVLNDSQLYSRYNNLKKRLDNLMLEWEQLQQEAEDLKKSVD